MRLALLMTALMSFACTKHESDDILTSGINAQISAVADGSGDTDVSATLFVGNPLGLNFVELAGDDELIASTGNLMQPMAETDILNIVTYSAEFAVDAEDTEFHVAFLRMIDDGAPDSYCTMPAPFDIITPPPATDVSRDTTDFIIDWDPPGSADGMRWEANGDCIDLHGETINGDPGTITITAGTLEKRMGNMIPDSCTVTVTIHRERSGFLDPGYGEGGNVLCKQVRGMSFTSSP